MWFQIYRKLAKIRLVQRTFIHLWPRSTFYWDFTILNKHLLIYLPFLKSPLLWIISMAPSVIYDIDIHVFEEYSLLSPLPHFLIECFLFCISLDSGYAFLVEYCIGGVIRCHIWRHTVTICSSLVMLILVTRSGCSVSPIYS